MTEEQYNNVNDINSDNDDDVGKHVYSMYKIQPINKDLKYSYIGHTKNFNNRCKEHIKNTTNINLIPAIIQWLIHI